MKTNNLKPKTRVQRSQICERLWAKMARHAKYIVDDYEVLMPNGFTSKGLRLQRRIDRIKPEFWYY